MNSKQGSRYIKRRMGNELKQKILEYNGIVSSNELQKKPSVLECPRCELVNINENKYCSHCSYPLVPEAYEEIKENEIQEIKKEVQGVKKSLNQFILLVQQNPKLAYINPEVLIEKMQNL
jgi:hypothetical protein